MSFLVSLLERILILQDQGPTLMTSFNLNYLMQRVDSLENTLMLGGIGGRRRRGRPRMRWLHGIIDSMDVSLVELWVMVMNRRPGVLRFMGSQRVGHD